MTLLSLVLLLWKKGCDRRRGLSRLHQPASPGESVDRSPPFVCGCLARTLVPGRFGLLAGAGAQVRPRATSQRAVRRISSRDSQSALAQKRVSSACALSMRRGADTWPRERTSRISSMSWSRCDRSEVTRSQYLPRAGPPRRWAAAPGRTFPTLSRNRHFPAKPGRPERILSLSSPLHKFWCKLRFFEKPGASARYRLATPSAVKLRLQEATFCPVSVPTTEGRSVAHRARLGHRCRFS